MPEIMDLAKYQTEAEELDNQGKATFVQAAESLLARPIETDEDYTACVELGNEAARREKVITDTFDEARDAANKAHRAILGLVKKLTADWTKYKDSLRGKAAAWYREQKRAKEAAEASLAAEARRVQAALSVQAQDLMDQGMVKEARALGNQAIATVAPVLPEATPRIAGARATERYKGTVVDSIAVMRAIVTGEWPLMQMVKGVERPLVVVDQVVLNALVDRMGKTLNLPGVTVDLDVKIGSTGRR